MQADSANYGKLFDQVRSWNAGPKQGSPSFRIEEPLRLRAVRAGGKLWLLPLAFWMGSEAPAFAGVDFNALWEYRLLGGEGQSTQQSLDQRYNFTAGVTLEPTNAIAVGAGIAYSSLMQDRNTGRTSNEMLTPSASVDVTNDIFSGRVAGSFTRIRNSADSGTNSYNWESSLASAWSWAWWPSLKLYYNGSGSEAEDNTADVRSADYGLDLGWDLRAFRLSYAYSRTHSEDLIGDSQTDGTSHIARLETERRLWGDRLSLKFAETLVKTEENFESVVPADGAVARPLTIQTFSAQEPGPRVPPPFADHRLTLASTPGLQNPRNTTGIVSIAPDQSWHLGVSLDLGDLQRVRQLWVLVDDSALDPTAGQAVLRWDLYVSADNDQWRGVAANVVATYNSAERRFEIAVPDSVLLKDPVFRYLKVVVSNLTTGPESERFTLKVRALQAVRLIEGAAGSHVSETTEQRMSTTDLSLGLRISRTLRASSYLYMTVGDTSSRRDMNGMLMWNPSPVVGATFGFTESRRSSEESPVVVERSYAVTVPLVPLPTANLVLGATRRDTFLDAEKTASLDSLTLTASGVLYPDLTTDLSGGYNTGWLKDLDEAPENRESYNGRFGLHAQLTPKLRADLSNNFVRTLQPTSSTAADSTLELNYRPSDYISMHFLGTRNWLADIPDFIRFDLDVALLRTRKTRVNFDYKYVRTDTDLHSLDLLASWDLSQMFMLKCHANYSIAELDTWSVITSLFLKL